MCIVWRLGIKFILKEPLENKNRQVVGKSQILLPLLFKKVNR